MQALRSMLQWRITQRLAWPSRGWVCCSRSGGAAPMAAAAAGASSTDGCSSSAGRRSVASYRAGPSPVAAAAAAANTASGSKPHTFLFTSESVTEGHPDKICDQVSDAVLDACLEQDPRSKVACEAAVKDNFLLVRVRVCVWWWGGGGGAWGAGCGQPCWGAASVAVARGSPPCHASDTLRLLLHTALSCCRHNHHATHAPPPPHTHMMHAGVW
jgi:hypothetical protein